MEVLFPCSLISPWGGALTCHQQQAQADHVQLQRGWEQQAQQQRQVPQVEEEVVGLLPLLTRAAVGRHSWDWGSG